MIASDTNKGASLRNFDLLKRGSLTRGNWKYTDEAQQRCQQSAHFPKIIITILSHKWHKQTSHQAQRTPKLNVQIVPLHTFGHVNVSIGLAITGIAKIWILMIMQARQLCDQAAQLLRGNVDNVILYYCCIAVEIAFVYPSIAVTNHFTFFFSQDYRSRKGICELFTCCTNFRRVLGWCDERSGRTYCLLELNNIF